MTDTKADTVTRAVVLVETGKPLELMTLGLPELKPGQVLVDVAWSGVCHSQLNEQKGLRGPDPYVPHTLGHEGSGVVAACGAGVTKVRPGDRVVLTWIKGEGADVPGTVYRGADGANVNSGAISTFMKRTVISENRLVPIADGMPLREAALLGCAVPTGAGIVFNNLALKAGETIAVFGIGGVGLSAVMAASLAGAGAIIAVDLVPARLDAAKSFGATHIVNAGNEDVKAAIAAATGGRGVDCAIEAAGAVPAIEAAFAAVRNGGGRCVVAGNPPHGARVTLDPFDFIRGKVLSGTWGGETKPDRDLPRYASMYMDGKMPLVKYVGREYGLSQVNEALADLADGSVLRPLINLGKD